MHLYFYEGRKFLQKLKLVSPIAPSVNHYLAYKTIIKNGKHIAMSYKTKMARDYKKNFIRYIKEQVKKQGWIKSENPFQHYYLDTYFYFPRVDMDANNYYKCIADSITESNVVWIDDVQLCERVQGIFYDSENPRIEMILHETDYIGIFENKSKLDEFETKCLCCLKYKRNCSLLKNAKEGRIQKEIKDGVCCKYSNIKK